MALEPKPPQTPLSPSSKGTSTPSSDPQDTQLSGPRGVEMKVSAAALDRGMLMAATTTQASAALVPPVAGVEPPSDAQIMLRVKAGDQQAFDYLVQKYRRPLVSFMYRMARNAAAAEDLAQEVLLRVYRSRGCTASRRTLPSIMRATRGTSGRRFRSAWTSRTRIPERRSSCRTET
jgi:hypothetical protein